MVKTRRDLGCAPATANLLYDFFTLALSVMDVVTDIFITVQWFQGGNWEYFYISCGIIFIASVSYTVMFIVVFCEERAHVNRWRATHFLCVFLCILPFSQVVPIFIFFASFEIKCLDAFLKRLGLNTLSEGLTMRKKIKAHEDPLRKYLEEKLYSHGGFICESIVESIPQSILQMAFIVATGQVSGLNVYSIGLSILSVASKSFMISHSIHGPTFAFNNFCFVIDIVNVFALVAWVFNDSSNELHDSALFGDKDVPTILWLYKETIGVGCMVVVLYVGGFVSLANQWYKHRRLNGWHHKAFPLLKYIALFLFLHVLFGPALIAIEGIFLSIFPMILSDMHSKFKGKDGLWHPLSDWLYGDFTEETRSEKLRAAHIYFARRCIAAYDRKGGMGSGTVAVSVARAALATVLVRDKLKMNTVRDWRNNVTALLYYNAGFMEEVRKQHRLVAGAMEEEDGKFDLGVQYAMAEQAQAQEGSMTDPQKLIENLARMDDPEFEQKKINGNKVTCTAIFERIKKLLDELGEQLAEEIPGEHSIHNRPGDQNCWTATLVALSYALVYFIGFFCLPWWWISNFYSAAYSTVMFATTPWGDIPQLQRVLSLFIIVCYVFLICLGFSAFKFIRNTSYLVDFHQGIEEDTLENIKQVYANRFSLVMQHNWRDVCLEIGNARANRGHPLANYITPLLPSIREYSGVAPRNPLDMNKFRKSAAYGHLLSYQAQVPEKKTEDGKGIGSGDEQLSLVPAKGPSKLTLRSIDHDDFYDSYLTQVDRGRRPDPLPQKKHKKWEGRRVRGLTPPVREEKVQLGSLSPSSGHDEHGSERDEEHSGMDEEKVMHGDQGRRHGLGLEQMLPPTIPKMIRSVSEQTRKALQSALLVPLNMEQTLLSTDRASSAGTQSLVRALHRRQRVERRNYAVTRRRARSILKHSREQKDQHPRPLGRQLSLGDMPAANPELKKQFTV